MKRNAIQELAAWNSSEDRKPMVLKGARQVGKTCLVKKFGQNDYDNFACFNFDGEDELKSIFEIKKTPQRIIALLSLTAGKKILPGKIRIIFDEIQECPEAYNYYLIIGGVPECVSSWTAHKDPAKIAQIQKELIKVYENDFSKHGGKVNSGWILMVFRSIVAQLKKPNGKFMCRAVRKGGRAWDFKEAIEWLASTKMLNRVYNASGMEHPPAAVDKLNQFKGPLTDNYALHCFKRGHRKDGKITNLSLYGSEDKRIALILQILTADARGCSFLEEGASRRFKGIALLLLIC